MEGTSSQCGELQVARSSQCHENKVLVNSEIRTCDVSITEIPAAAH